MARKVLWAVLVIGVMLIAAPFVMGLPDKASGGQKMMDAFNPIMQQENVDETARYYYEVFVPLGDVAPALNEEMVARYEGYLAGMTAMQADVAKLFPALAGALGMTAEQVQAFMLEQFPDMTAMLQQFPTLQEDMGQMVGMMAANTDIFAQVPAGLEHYKPLVETMQAQVDNYDKVNSLPDFTMFTWFFVIPGLLLVVLSLLGLFVGREPKAVTPATAPAMESIDRTPHSV